MTDEEKAEEYIKNVRTEWENQTYWVDCTDEVKQAYLDGLTEGRKEKCIIEQDKDGTIKLCDIAKEKAELKNRITFLETQAKIDFMQIIELKEQIDQLSNDNHVLKTSFILQQEQIKKMECCYNCKHSEINFTSDSGIKLTCKKLRRKSDDCILNNYKDWELAE